MPDYQILRTEIDTDPLSRGYSGMSDTEVADDMNLINRDNWVSVTSAQIYEAVDGAEYGALTDLLNGDEIAALDRIFGLGGDIPSAPGGRVRGELISIFGGGSTTIQNLVATANQQISRGSEIGWGVVKTGDVTAARAL